MVKLIYVGLYRKFHSSMNLESNIVRLGFAVDLSIYSLFTRNTAMEYINFSTRTAALQTNLMTKTNISIEVANNTYNIYSYSANDGLNCTIITDLNYPKLAIDTLMYNLMNTYRSSFNDWQKIYADQNDELQFLKTALSQKPEDIDKLCKINKELEDIKEIMYKNIDDIIKRREDIEDLIKGSHDLSNDSKKFVYTAKKMRCCPLF